ncbi:hypothetical protein D6D01_04947 [Aureobasidium pullulans]|uniref:Uncharacterized protein n=1 Tax=Aureobasidium pullulans TaxID=5580 RepID=A0A4S9LAF1_AURPU|nr:hypothetical protein D6D01_04947 [Aureobasidium pullulans]
MCAGEKRTTQCANCNIKTFEKFIWLGCASGKQRSPSGWTELNATCPSTVVDMVRLNRCTRCEIALLEMQLNIPDPANNPGPVRSFHPEDPTCSYPPIPTYDWSQTMAMRRPSRAETPISATKQPSADTTAQSTDKPSKISRLGAPLKRMLSRRARTRPSRPSSHNSSVYPTSSGRHHHALNSAGRSGPAPQPQFIQTPRGPHSNPLRSNPVDLSIFRPTNVQVVPEYSPNLPGYEQSSASQQPPSFLIARAADNCDLWDASTASADWQRAFQAYDRGFQPRLNTLVTRTNRIITPNTSLNLLSLLSLIAAELDRIRTDAERIAVFSSRTEPDNFHILSNYETLLTTADSQDRMQSRIIGMEELYGRLTTSADYMIQFVSYRMDAYLAHAEKFIGELEQR